MTNKEKYKKAFSALEPHECSFQEVEQMAVLQKKLPSHLILVNTVASVFQQSLALCLFFIIQLLHI